MLGYAQFYVYAWPRVGYADARDSGLKSRSKPSGEQNDAAHFREVPTRPHPASLGSCLMSRFLALEARSKLGWRTRKVSGDYTLKTA